MFETPQNLPSRALRPTSRYDRFFFGHGKILLSGEYFLLDGACGLAFPTRLGQSMGVSYAQRFDPKLTWRAFDANGELWFEASFELWHFQHLGEGMSKEARQLQKILRAAREQNKHFLRQDEGDVIVETHLDFPLEWGLGSSSTLICNVAQWAYVSPFELAAKSWGGSGYDIACAQVQGPILYQNQSQRPQWETVCFDPPFKDHLYFVYQGSKQKTEEAIDCYKRKTPPSREQIESVSALTRKALAAKTLEEFHQFMRQHEEIVAKHLGQVPLKARQFPDYWGEMKSLGAWGGDFALVSSERPFEETRDYFRKRGLPVVLKFEDLALKESSPLVH